METQFNQNVIPTATEEHLFNDEEIIQYEEASNGQRFLNYIIDYLVMTFGVDLLTGYLLGLLLNAVSREAAYTLFAENEVAASLLLGILNFLIYYTFCEKIFRGYTLGKLVTGTRVIREDGQELLFSDAFLRSLSRLVPFEPLSIWFGNGMWHDTWTKTQVIKTR